VLLPGGRARGVLRPVWRRLLQPRPPPEPRQVTDDDDDDDDDGGGDDDDDDDQHDKWKSPGIDHLT
jgi:hypothetical protein